MLSNPARALRRQRDVVLGEDLPDGSALRAHHQAVGLSPPVVVLDPAEDATTGDAGDRDAHVATWHQLLHGDRLLRVEARRAHRHGLVLVAHPGSAVQLTAEASHRAGGDDRLLSPAGPD